MNREIKFRAWDNTNKENPHMLGPYFLTDTIFNYKEIRHLHLMQFTGLKDKQGVDIYEGDIVNQEIWVSVGKYAPSIGVIKYKGIKFTSECIDEWKGSNADLNGNASVIGNIYENSYLLK